MKMTGSMIRLVRANTGMNQTEFAEKAGISRAVLSLVEINKIPLSRKVEKAIREAFAIDDEMLYTIMESRFKVFAQNANFGTIQRGNR